MKTRSGFVSNSSSSSFIISLDDITGKQLKQIRDHRHYGKKLGLEYADDEWNISVTDTHVKGDTIMDNFDMREFLDKIGVPEEAVQWDEYGGSYAWDEWYSDDNFDTLENDDED